MLCDSLYSPNPTVRRYPPVDLLGKPLPLENHPKVLGVHFDTMHKFAHHCKLAAAKGSRGNNVLKALTGTNWGQDKETILMTYKTTVRSVTEYVSPVWARLASTSSVNRLQKVQNAALRTATGNHKMAPSLTYTKNP